MKELKVRELVIGKESDCKICVPIVGTTKEEILEQTIVVKEAKPDLAELRIDYFQAAHDLEQTKELLQMVRKELGSLPIIFTLRTKEEGGELSVSKEDYETLLLMAAQTGSTDLIDVELNLGEAFVKPFIQRLKKCGVFVILSNHDFEKTPNQEELLRRMRTMQKLGADIAKVATMPRSASDVLGLLEATNIMKERYADIPIVTMAMGKLGAISRVSGAVFGSGITFASVGKASAPGQIEIEELRRIMRAIA